MRSRGSCTRWANVTSASRSPHSSDARSPACKRISTIAQARALTWRASSRRARYTGSPRTRRSTIDGLISTRIGSANGTGRELARLGTWLYRAQRAGSPRLAAHECRAIWTAYRERRSRRAQEGRGT